MENTLLSWIMESVFIIFFFFWMYSGEFVLIILVYWFDRIRLVAVATQKFVADVASDALQ